MHNKRLFILLGAVVAICFNFLWLSGSAINLQLNLSDGWNILDEDSFKEKVSTIHFKDNWNDFWWFIYLIQWSGWALGEDELEQVSISWDFTWYDCAQFVEWFYYNEERWDRLWPLDMKTAETWDMISKGLQLSGAIYTRCILSWYDAELADCKNNSYYDTEDKIEQCVSDVKEKHRDTYWYYGFVEHKYSWQQMKLFFGTNYELMSDGTMSGWVVATWSLEPSLIRIGNKFPVWFVYDYNWWAGFVWCRVWETYWIRDVFNKYESNRDWNYYFKVNNDFTGVDVIESSDGMDGRVVCGKIWSAKDTLLSIVIEWIVWMGRNYNDAWYIWNQGNEKMQLFSSVDVNNTTLINYAKQKAETLCRGKWETEEPFETPSDKMVCLEKIWWFIDASQEVYNGVTLIVKWWADVSIKPDVNKVYNIFIDWWNLLIEEDIDSDEQFVIGSNWFIVDDVEKKFLAWAALYSYFWREAVLLDIPATVNLVLNNGFDWWGGWENKVDCECDKFNVNERMLCKTLDDYLGNGDGWLMSTEVEGMASVVLGSSDYRNNFSVASVLKWNFIVNWIVRKIGDGKLKNKYFIYWKFTTKDSFSALEKTFGWRCFNWEDINWKPCLQFWSNLYSNAALSIIDQNYDSPLFK